MKKQNTKLYLKIPDVPKDNLEDRLAVFSYFDKLFTNEEMEEMLQKLEKKFGKTKDELLTIIKSF